MYQYPTPDGALLVREVKQWEIKTKGVDSEYIVEFGYEGKDPQRITRQTPTDLQLVYGAAINKFYAAEVRYITHTEE